jgi:C4-type Zn-finger protein
MWKRWREPMRDKLNCPNCGAPITSIECPYCGSVFYDLVTLDSTKPTYIRMVWNDQIIMSRVVLRSTTVNISYYDLPSIDIELMAVPDDDGVTIRQERKTDEQT